ncbi:MAG: cold shock domain-containing protein [Sinobacterium sp.]|nr:cold shock domain-containing protein [Sinobacterium sp.]
MAAFLLATLITVVLCKVVSSNSTDKPARAKKKPKAAKASAQSSDAPLTASDADREVGSVKWFNVSKGFGFITRENDEDIFVHYRSIRGQGRRRLFEGQDVEFAVIDSDKGLQADDVEVL